MDFLLLLPRRVRVVIEVDGKQHYAEAGTASPRLYAAMAAEDRRLRVRGYEVYRFGAYELTQRPNAAALSDRMLETLRAQGLIPRPSRSGSLGRIPVWTYPAGADRQLLTVLRWRQYTKDTDILRMLVWLDGFPVPTVGIRASLIRWAETTIRTLDDVIHSFEQNGETGDAVDEIASIRPVRTSFWLLDQGECVLEVGRQRVLGG